MQLVMIWVFFWKVLDPIISVKIPTNFFKTFQGHELGNSQASINIIGAPQPAYFRVRNYAKK